MGPDRSNEDVQLQRNWKRVVFATVKDWIALCESCGQKVTARDLPADHEDRLEIYCRACTEGDL